MAKLELSHEEVATLESVLKRCLRENQDMIQKMHSLGAKLQRENDGIGSVLQKLLIIPRVAKPMPMYAVADFEIKPLKQGFR